MILVLLSFTQLYKGSLRKEPKAWYTLFLTVSGTKAALLLLLAASGFSSIIKVVGLLPECFSSRSFNSAVIPKARVILDTFFAVSIRLKYLVSMARLSRGLNMGMTPAGIVPGPSFCIFISWLMDTFLAFFL